MQNNMNLAKSITNRFTRLAKEWIREVDPRYQELTPEEVATAQQAVHRFQEDAATDHKKFQQALSDTQEASKSEKGRTIALTQACLKKQTEDLKQHIKKDQNSHIKAQNQLQASYKKQHQSLKNNLMQQDEAQKQQLSDNKKTYEEEI